MKTLIVANNLMEQCLLAKVLTELGHEVVSYENAEQAILAYQKQIYPLLVVDSVLPGMSGLQFCRWVRSMQDGDKVYVMVLTAPKQPADLNQVLEAGANDFIPKPLDPSSLKVRLTVAGNQMKGFFERKEVERLLEESQESFDRVVKAAREGVWWLGADFRTEFTNPRMAELLGETVDELQGRPALDFFPEHFQPLAAGMIDEQRLAEMRLEVPLLRKDGGEWTALLAGAPVLNPKGEFQGALWMITDLSPQRKMEEQSAKAKSDLAREIDVLTGRLRATEEKAAEEAARLTQELEKVQRYIQDGEQETQIFRRKATEDLLAESQLRRLSEEALTKAREELKTRVEQLNAELAQNRDALQVETKRVAEAQAQLRKQAEQLAQSADSLKSESASRKELETALRKAQEHTQSLSQQHAQATAALNQSLKDEAGERRRLAESVEKVQKDAEVRAAEAARKLAESEQRIQAVEKEHKQQAEAARQAQQERDQRIRELDQALKFAQKEADALAAQQKQLTETADRLRTGREQMVRETTAEVAALKQALQTANQERERLTEKLALARADAAKPQDKAELEKLAANLREISAERDLIQDELRQSREENAVRLKQQTTELLGIQQQIRSLMAERQKGDQDLSQLREEIARRAREQMSDMLKAADDVKSVLAERRQLQNEVERLTSELRVACASPTPDTSHFQIGPGGGQGKPVLAAVGA